MSIKRPAVVRRAAMRLAVASALASSVALVATTFALSAAAQVQTQDSYDPTVGQAGKDVVWVPTPPAVVEKMLDMAKVTATDFVVDLGSGDGRNVIGAAKRGAKAVGFEYNPDMVELSRRLAKEAGVADKATFVQGDMYEAQFSEATVLALFLLPTNLEKLKDKILALKPGTRVVMNTFTVDGWEADETETVGGDCTSWCTALLWIVPAKVEGTWTTPKGDLKLTQQFQKVTGSLGTQAISEGKLRGDEITFKAGGTTYTGKVEGNMIHGSGWMATRKG